MVPVKKNRVRDFYPARNSNNYFYMFSFDTLSIKLYFIARRSRVKVRNWNLTKSPEVVNHNCVRFFPRENNSWKENWSFYKLKINMYVLFEPSFTSFWSRMLDLKNLGKFFSWYFLHKVGNLPFISFQVPFYFSMNYNSQIKMWVNF